MAGVEDYLINKQKEIFIDGKATIDPPDELLSFRPRVEKIVIKDAKLQLGDGKTADIGLDPLTFPPPPVELGGEADLLAASAGDTTCARLTDGSLRCWGANQSGQVGDGTSGCVTIPAAARRVDPAFVFKAGFELDE